MPASEPLVSIGLPVRNGEHRVPSAIMSALTQRYSNIELVISDNASTDGTEEVCREFARRDPRVAYYRQDQNIGLLNNFVATMQLARGDLFCWLGDDDELQTDYLGRCVEVLANEERFVLVTTDTSVLWPDGVIRIASYNGTAMSSADPVDRFGEMLRLLDGSDSALDPISAVMRREPIAAITRRNMLREDQVFAAKMALAGPWGHIPEVLSYCYYDDIKRPDLARRLGVPVWQARFATALQFQELMRVVSDADLGRGQKRRARSAVRRWYVGWHRRRVVNKLRRMRPTEKSRAASTPPAIERQS
jgi:glycosyltransferase involved in cell wall biosynthesis